MTRKFACTVLAAAMATAPAYADTAPATASAITLTPLSILNIGDLDFGTNVSSPVAGTIVIDPNTDGRSTTGGVVAAGGVPKAAKFYTYGTGNQSVQITNGPLPVLNRGGGGATMNVSALSLNGPALRFLSVAGLIDLRVGGTLDVAADQLDGVYSGTFDLTVTYF